MRDYLFGCFGPIVILVIWAELQLISLCNGGYLKSEMKPLHDSRVWIMDINVYCTSLEKLMATILWPVMSNGYLNT